MMRATLVWIVFVMPMQPIYSPKRDKKSAKHEYINFKEKNMKIKLFLLLIVLFLAACEINTNSYVIGIQENTIKLSAKAHVFSAQGGCLIITTEGTQWMIGGCNIDSKSYTFGCSSEDESFDMYEDITFYCDSYDHGTFSYYETSKIKSSWFTITKETLQKIVFNVLPNETGKKRKIQLLLSDHNYFTSIEIDQLAE